MHTHSARMLLALTLLLLAGPAWAEDNLTTEIRSLAADIKKLLDGRNETSIAIGTFDSAPKLPASAGPIFVQLLHEELRNLKIDVRKRAKLTLKGLYRLVEDTDSGLAAVELKVKFIDEDGEEIGALKLKPRGIFGDATVAGVLGLSVKLPPEGSDKERDKEIRDAYTNPRTNLDPGKTIVRSRAGSLYAIELLVKKGDKYVPRAVKDEEGLAFAKIESKEEYAVRIINDADHEVAVALTIDGLNMFTFSTLRGKDGKPLYSRFLVGKKSSALIEGWHRDNEVSEKFLVDQYNKSAAAEMGATSNLGTITAVFAAAWKKDADPPADEPTRPTRRAKSADATARGARFKVKWIEEKRLFGVARDSVSVHYSK